MFEFLLYFITGFVTTLVMCNIMGIGGSKK